MRWLARALMVVAIAACTSPTLPLPPPALPTISSGTEPNSYRLRSEKGAIPNALVVAVSRNDTLIPEDRVNGTLANAEGSWEMTVKGQPTDIIDLTQDNGTGTSPSISITLPAK